MTADFIVYRDGSICLLRPVTAAAGEWALEHIRATVWHAGAVAVETNHIAPILEGIQADGLTVEEEV